MVINHDHDVEDDDAAADDDNDGDAETHTRFHPMHLFRKLVTRLTMSVSSQGLAVHQLRGSRQWQVQG